MNEYFTQAKGFYDAGGPFSLLLNSSGKKIQVNKNSYLLPSFNPGSRIEIAGIGDFIDVIDNIKIWIEIYLNNSSGDITAAIKNSSAWWSADLLPYALDPAQSEGKFQGQTVIYVPVASMIVTDGQSKKDGIKKTGSGLIYRYLRQDLMVVQFCNRYVALPIGTAIRV